MLCTCNAQVLLPTEGHWAAGSSKGSSGQGPAEPAAQSWPVWCSHAPPAWQLLPRAGHVSRSLHPRSHSWSQSHPHSYSRSHSCSHPHPELVVRVIFTPTAAIKVAFTFQFIPMSQPTKDKKIDSSAAERHDCSIAFVTIKLAHAKAHYTPYLALLAVADM